MSRSENRLDFVEISREPEVSGLDFDLKREPVIDDGWVGVVDGYEVFCFPTKSWDNVLLYDKAVSVAKRIRSNRPGASHLTGCLRTKSEWLTWDRRFRSAPNRRVRTAGSAFLTELVAAHKEGLVDVPYLSSKCLSVTDKIRWLSSLGFGEFSKAQWDHMSKVKRRQSVLADCDLDAVEQFVGLLDEEAA